MISNEEIDSEENDMDYSSHLYKLVLHSFPIIFGGSIAVAATFGNAVIITSISNEAVAANAYISSTKNLLIYPPRSIFFALQPLIGTAFKEKDYPTVGKYWRYSLLLGLGFSAILSIPLLNIEFILKKSHQNEALSEITGHYFYLYTAAVPANLTIEIINELFVTTGNEYLLIPSSVLRTGLELGLNLLFINYLKMGINGWAISSLLQPLISCFILLSYIASTQKFSKLKLFDINSDCADYRQTLSAIYQKQKEILQLGSPIFLQASVAFGAYFIDILMLGKMDLNGMTAFNTCNQWSAWIINVHTALSTSACVLTSYQIASNKLLDAEKTGKTAIALGALISVMYLIISSLAYEPMTAALLHSDHNKKNILSSAKILMPIVGACTAGFGLKFITAGAIRGYQQTKISMLADMSGTVVGLGLSAVLGFVAKQDAVGIATGEALGLMIASVLILVFFSKKTTINNRYSSMFNSTQHVFNRLSEQEKKILSLETNTFENSPLHHIVKDEIGSGSDLFIGNS